MINKEIPFRPNLEGEFRTRFYDLALHFSTAEVDEKVVDYINKEINWVEDECLYNISQRKIYRASLYLLRDLINAGWDYKYVNGCLYLTASDNKKYNGLSDFHDAKKHLRQYMSDSRIEKIRLSSSSILAIEAESQHSKSIKSLITDGKELFKRLVDARDNVISITDAIKPYLQLVEENVRDSFTNIKLSDIWRYFRMTWSSPYETTPGRTMQYLVRDAAAPNHAVMGILSLENCAVQITDRDNYIGWNTDGFIEECLNIPHDKIGNEIQRLLSYIDDGISSINTEGLCSKDDLDNPTESIISQISIISQSAEMQRQNSLKEDVANSERSDLGQISKQTEDALYLRKRGDSLYKLLKAKKSLQDFNNSNYSVSDWQFFCKSETGSSSIRNALVAQKTKHIGSSMMELNVCGAIPPYNEVLGGKLVALLALSPQVIHDYKKKYQDKPSEIASRIKGEDVCRPADLVYIGTTSLYNIGSSQYNRLIIPGEIFESSFDIKWRRIGMTQGFGSWHISRGTSFCLSDVTNETFKKINHVFGEGASPKLRLLSASIPKIFENGEEAKFFSRHAMQRIVFGAMIASNSKRYLLGLDDTPLYPFSIENFKQETNKIIQYWQKRWLSSRLNWAPIFEKILSFDPNEMILSQFLDVNDNVQVSNLKEPMATIKDSSVDFDYIRAFYRGSSAYADHVDKEILDSIHISTKLDQAVIDCLKKGLDVVLTGNPGDGKTHLIRVNLPQFPEEVVVELDASTKTNKQIYDIWRSARNANRPFLIAVNAAVLYSLYSDYSDFEPISSAYKQMINSICFERVSEQTEPSVVLYDLSKRNVLSKEVVSAAIKKLSSKQFYEKCKKCPLLKSCDVHRNRSIINSDLFQERLNYIFKRVTMMGYHASLRELQGFISYLIFADRTCDTIARTNGSSNDPANLIYSGKGLLFKKIKDTFDPAYISHPILDEDILSNNIPTDGWIEPFIPSKDSIDPNNDNVFVQRKRQYFFYNSGGSSIIEVLDDDMTNFISLIQTCDSSVDIQRKPAKMEIIKKLNSFFSSTSHSDSEIKIWTSHRYDMEPRKVLLSIRTMRQKEFNVLRPQINPIMNNGIEASVNYVTFYEKGHPDISLKVDFPMYVLLQKAERGVPLLFLEQNLSSKVWRFMDQLHSLSSEIEDNYSVSLLDLHTKKTVTVEIEIDEELAKYNSVTISR